MQKEISLRSREAELTFLKEGYITIVRLEELLAMLKLTQRVQKVCQVS